MNELSEGTDLYLLLPSGAPVSARVDRAEPGCLVLQVFPGRRSTLPDLGGDRVELQFTSRRGVCRLSGSASPGAAPLTVEFRYSGEALVVQRRDFVRVDAAVPVSYQPIGPSGWTVETYTLNLGGGGFLLADPQGLFIGDMAGFRIALPDDPPPVEAVGRAVRQVDGGALGIQFVEIAERDRQRIVHHVFARERQARSLARRR